MIHLSIPAILFLSELLLIKLLMIIILLLSKDKSDSSKIAWMLLIIALPFIGTAIFLFVGTRRLGSIRRKRHKKIQATIPQNVTSYIKDPKLYDKDVDSRFSSIAHIAETIGGSHVLSGNNAILLGDSDEMIDSVANDIRNAKKHCHILSYIMLVDKAGEKISEALVEATARGVQCRLLLDSIGSKHFLASDLCKTVKEAGVHVVEALPANLLRAIFARVDLRNHRKIAVIDNSIGYMGSNNIAEPSFAPKPKFAPWVDASVRLTGPIVRELQAIFIQDWFMDSDEDLSSILKEPLQIEEGFPTQLMATGPNSNNLALSQLLQTAFFTAQKELIITTPYFSPDDSTESALLISAKRGVETHLVLPARNDSKLVQAASKSRYTVLLNAGVQIHEYNGGLLHAKTMTIDRDIALIGSANLDRRSLDLNFEINMLVYDTDFASELRLLQMTYIQQSTSVPPKTPSQWSIGKRLWQNGVSLFAPIL